MQPYFVLLTSCFNQQFIYFILEFIQSSWVKTIWSCSFVNIHFECLFHSLLCEGLSLALCVPSTVEHWHGKLPSLMTANDLSSASALVHNSSEGATYFLACFIVLGKRFTINFNNLFHKCSLVYFMEFLPLTHQIL